jgi:hypothetical protein
VREKEETGERRRIEGCIKIKRSKVVISYIIVKYVFNKFSSFNVYSAALHIVIEEKK